MKHRRSERGVALIICLLALMLLSGIGLGMMYMADTETSINNNYRDSQQAYFAAIAGLQEVRERVRAKAANPVTLPTTLPANGTATGVTYVLNWDDRVARADIKPWQATDDNLYFDSEFCHENFAGVSNAGNFKPCPPTASSLLTGTYYTAVDSTMPTLVGTTPNLPYRWVRITQKINKAAVPDPSSSGTPATGFYVNASGSLNNVPVCWTGNNQVLKPVAAAACENVLDVGGWNFTTVYVLTSLAVSRGGSRRMAQMEVALDPPFLTNAALDTNDFVTISGASVTVNGYDNCKCACTTAKGGEAPTCTDRITGGACTGTTYAIYSSQTVDKEGALVAGTTPTVAENQPFPYDVPKLIATYSSQPGAVNLTGSPYNLSCTPATPPAYPYCGKLNNGVVGTIPNPFPPSDPNYPVGAVNQISYVPGSLEIDAKTTGAGILIVDGDLTINGGMQFYGLIIVRGILTFAGSGLGQDVNVLGSIITGNSSIADDTLKGGINVQFDHCALLNNQLPAPPRVISTHEVTY